MIIMQQLTNLNYNYESYVQYNFYHNAADDIAFSVRFTNKRNTVKISTTFFQTT